MTLSVKVFKFKNVSSLEENRDEIHELSRHHSSHFVETSSYIVERNILISSIAKHAYCKAFAVPTLTSKYKERIRERFITTTA